MRIDRCRILLPVLLLCVLLYGCHKRTLSVYTDFISVEDLASFYVNTPDPFLNYPPFEQRLIISWNLPEGCLENDPVILNVQLRLKNHSEIKKTVAVRKKTGTYILFLNRCDFCETGGILTFRIELLQGENILCQKTHLLWKKLIQFEDYEEHFPKDD